MALLGGGSRPRITFFTDSFHERNGGALTSREFACFVLHSGLSVVPSARGRVKPLPAPTRWKLSSSNPAQRVSRSTAARTSIASCSVPSTASRAGPVSSFRASYTSAARRVRTPRLARHPASGPPAGGLAVHGSDAARRRHGILVKGGEKGSHYRRDRAEPAIPGRTPWRGGGKDSTAASKDSCCQGGWPNAQFWKRHRSSSSWMNGSTAPEAYRLNRQHRQIVRVILRALRLPAKTGSPTLRRNCGSTLLLPLTALEGIGVAGTVVPWLPYPARRVVEE